MFKKFKYISSLIAVLTILFCLSLAIFGEESHIDISKYTESTTYHVETIIPTEYGTVLYLWPVGVPHGGINPNLVLIKEDGSESSLSSSVPRKDFFHYPELNKIKLSKDGKTLTFSVSFDERAEGSVAGNEPVVLHDAGTYYYESNLMTGETIEIKFEPVENISDWAEDSVEKAIELGIASADLKEKCKENITREEFFELIYNLIAEYSKEELPQTSQSAPFGDTNNEKIIKLWWWGIVKGKGTFTQEPVVSPDGFVKRYPTLTIIKPGDYLTREEAATLIIRMVEKFFPMPATEMWFEYRDANEISDWASNSVQVISNLGFMRGVGNNNFAPKSAYTTEQAIVTVMRVCESAGKIDS